MSISSSTTTPSTGWRLTRSLKHDPGIQWPFVDGLETKWRYNAKYDPAAKGDDFDFYGKPDHTGLDMAAAL